MLVSASFAIGTSISNVVSALIFVLLMRPYQVGDRVTCSDVFGGQETLLVIQVRVLAQRSCDPALFSLSTKLQGEEIVICAPQIDVLTTTFQRNNNKVCD